MNLRYFLSCQFFKVVYNLPVSKSQAVIAATDSFTYTFRHRLTGFFAVVLNLRNHISGLDENLVVGVNKALETFTFCRFGCDFTIVNGLSLCFPISSALLDNPQTGYIFKETNGSESSAFVGIIGFTRGFGNERLIKFHTHKRPSSARDETEVFLVAGNGQNSGGCVVFTYGIYGNIILGTQFFFDFVCYCA